MDYKPQDVQAILENGIPLLMVPTRFGRSAVLISWPKQLGNSSTIRAKGYMKPTPWPSRY